MTSISHFSSPSAESGLSHRDRNRIARNEQLARRKRGERWLGRGIAVVLVVGVVVAWFMTRPPTPYADRPIDAALTAEALAFIDADFDTEVVGELRDHVSRDAYVLGALEGEARVTGARIDQHAVAQRLLLLVDDGDERLALTTLFDEAFADIAESDNPSGLWPRLVTVLALAAAHDPAIAADVAKAPSISGSLISQIDDDHNFVHFMGDVAVNNGYLSLLEVWDDDIVDLPNYDDRDVDLVHTRELLDSISVETNPNPRTDLFDFYGNGYSRSLADEGTRIDMRAVADAMIASLSEPTQTRLQQIMNDHLTKPIDGDLSDKRRSAEQRRHDELLVATMAYAQISEEHAAEVLDWVDSSDTSDGLTGIVTDDGPMGHQIRDHLATLTYEFHSWAGAFRD